MKIVGQLTILICLLAVGCVTFWSEAITLHAIDVWRFGWLFSYLLPRVVVLILCVFSSGAVFLFLQLPKLGKAVLSFLVLALSVGGYLLVNPPYINDWTRTGTALAADDNNTDAVDMLVDHNPNYNGLVMLVLPDCPYCIEQFETLKRLSARNPELNLSAVVVGRNSSDVEVFQAHVGPSEIPVFFAPNSMAVAKLSQGRFPSFLYLKGGAFVYRWSNAQFGFPALDMVEDGMGQLTTNLKD